MIQDSSKKPLNDPKNKKLTTMGLIDAEWFGGSSSKSTFDVIDPATLDKLVILPEMDKADVDKAVDATPRL